jgi:hypothetical protein
MREWTDYLHSDKTLLALILALLVCAWLWTRDPKLFDLGNTTLGALIAIITGSVTRRNGSNNDSTTR